MGCCVWLGQRGLSESAFSRRDLCRRRSQCHSGIGGFSEAIDVARQHCLSRAFWVGFRRSFGRGPLLCATVAHIHPPRERRCEGLPSIGAAPLKGRIKSDPESARRAISDSVQKRCSCRTVRRWTRSSGQHVRSGSVLRHAVRKQARLFTDTGQFVNIVSDHASPTRHLKTNMNYKLFRGPAVLGLTFRCFQSIGPDPACVVRWGVEGLQLGLKCNRTRKQMRTTFWQNGPPGCSVPQGSGRSSTRPQALLRTPTRVCWFSNFVQAAIFSGKPSRICSTADLVRFHLVH